MLYIAVKSGVLFPPILQHCRQYCNVHVLIAPNKLHRNLQVATISISTIRWFQYFLGRFSLIKVLPNNIGRFAVFLSAKICQENIEINKFVEIGIVATCKFRYNLLWAISAWITLQYWRQCCNIIYVGNRTPDLTVNIWINKWVILNRFLCKHKRFSYFNMSTSIYPRKNEFRRGGLEVDCSAFYLLYLCYAAILNGVWKMLSVSIFV